MLRMLAEQPFRIGRVYEKGIRRSRFCSCALLTGTPAHVRLDKLPLCELRQHHLDNTPQPLHAFIGDGICGMSGMRSRNRYLDGMIRSKGLSLHEASVSWELVAQFDDPAVFARFVIFDEAGLEEKALQGNRWRCPIGQTSKHSRLLRCTPQE